jgi:hypothetical protein
MKPWFEDFKELIRSDKVLEFWPTNAQTPADRINAASRFVIYASCIIYLIRRDPRIFVLGITVLGVLIVMYRSNMVKGSQGRPTVSEQYTGNTCQMPNEHNPMANVLLTDITDDPERAPACFYPSVKGHVKYFGEDRVQYDGGRSRTSMPEFQRNASARQFVSMPVTSIPGDQTAFAEWLYGAKMGPMCKDGSMSTCDPNARGAQLGAFRGLQASGDRR